MRRKWTAAGQRTWHGLAALVLAGGGYGSAVAACPAPAIALEPLAPGVWRVPGAEGGGDSDTTNGGAVSNLLAVRDGRRLWLIGSGPSPRYAEALACRLQRVAGRAVTDVVAPWPRPELVLGQAGWVGARRWAHADVAQAMAERCPRCIERLRQRLGPASGGDLGTRPIALPDRLLHGDHGVLGPLRWWRLQRSADTAVTVWSLPRARLLTAHGLLWADGAPDLRDAESEHLQQSWARMQALATEGDRWVPEQGPLLDHAAPLQHRAYLQALHTAVVQAQERGELESKPAPVLDGVAAAFHRGGRHALNWQHVWREAEKGW